MTLATNTKKTISGGETIYRRKYPQHGFAAQTVGYSTESRAQAGLERSMNDYLTGANTNLSDAFRHILDRLGNATVHGNNLELTIRPGAQRLAQQLLGNRCGAVVAMNPHTGAVYVMASSPTYDLNLIDKPGGYAKVLKTRGACAGASALYNRATQGLYVPGSTFKMITAAAALDTGAFKADSTFYDPGYCTVYGKPVSNAGNPDQGGREVFGHLNFVTAFQHSVNSVFCNIGKQLGAGTLLSYAKKFGFYKTPPLETPANERAPSGLYNGTKLYIPKDSEQGRRRAPRVRAGAHARDAAADGDGRRRRSGTAASCRSRTSSRRSPSRGGTTVRTDEARQPRPRDQARDRRDADADDGRRRPRAARAMPRRSRGSTSPARPEPPKPTSRTSIRPGLPPSLRPTIPRSRSPSSSRSS